MDDLISRQAVLNATSATLKITGKENAETVYAYIKKLCDDIKALPSAQQWISCSEKLPEDSNLKWLAFFDGKKHSAYVGFYDQAEGWCEPTYGNRYAENITAWMDIPKPEPFEEI